MGIYPVEKLAEGMVLGSDVKDPFGRTLMNSGQELQSRHIEVLRAYNIVEINIAGSESIKEADADEADPALFETASKELEALFAGADLSWDVMKQIHRSAVMLSIKNKRVGSAGHHDS